MAPNWIRTENVSQNSLRAGSEPRSWFTSKRWPVDDPGRKSVRPSTMPSTMALKKSNDIRGLRTDRESHGAWTGQPQGGDRRLFYQHQPGGKQNARHKPKTGLPPA